MILAVALYVLLILFLCFVLVIDSALENFSRSRLEKYCSTRNPKMLGLILQFDDPAMFAARVWTWFSVAGLVAPYAVDSGILIPTTWLVGLMMLIAVLQLLVFGPAGKAFAEPILYWCWPFINALRLLLLPLLLIRHATNAAFTGMNGQHEDPSTSPIQEEILTVVNEGEREGAILLENAADMIEGLMELHDVEVVELMTPRTDMVMLSHTSTLEEASRTIVQCGHSRIPVYSDSRDNIVGILYAKDLLQYLHLTPPDPGDLRALHLREPVYVPETKPVDVLLQEFQHGRVHIAIVLDEYGGVSGLVTIEDILEEIVGDIADEYDLHEKPPIEQVSERVFDVDARVHVDELNESLRIKIPEDADYDTLAGFVFTVMGKVPKIGESVNVNDAEFTVLVATDRTIDRVRIELPDLSESGKSDSREASRESAVPVAPAGEEAAAKGNAAGSAKSE